MLYTDDTSSFTLCDLVMAKTIQQTWGEFRSTRQTFAQGMDNIALAAVKRAWKIAYIENYKNRDRLRQEMTCPAVLEGVPSRSNGLDDYDLCDYMVDSSYTLVLISKRTIKALPRPANRGAMPEEYRERFEAMMRRVGIGGEKFDWYFKEFPGRGKTVPPDVRRGDGDVPRDDRLWDPITGAARPATRATPGMPDDRAAGDAADRDAAEFPKLYKDGAKPTSERVYCTCSGVRNGGPCTCPPGTHGQD